MCIILFVLGIQCSRDSILLWSQRLNVSLEITLTPLSSFIKFENPRIISGSERIMGGS